MKETFITNNKMSNENVIDVLKELKLKWTGKTPSKYFFALERAISSLENDLNKCNCDVGDGCSNCNTN